MNQNEELANEADQTYSKMGATTIISKMGAAMMSKKRAANECRREGRREKIFGLNRN